MMRTVMTEAGAVAETIGTEKQVTTGRLDAAAVTTSRALARLAVASGAAGMVSTIGHAPALQATLLAFFAITGVGSAVTCWLRLPLGPTIAATIGLSLAGTIAVASQLVTHSFWHPVQSCMTIGALVAVAGGTRLWLLRNRSSAGLPLRIG
jgi:hypothetical protein